MEYAAFEVLSTTAERSRSKKNESGTGYSLTRFEATFSTVMRALITLAPLLV
jgi:hypothetical protein